MTRRYEDWTHVRVNGDRHAAAPYLGEGRKLLGQVFEEAKHNNLGVHLLRRRLEDGTVIVAEKIGDMPRITIAPTQAQQPGIKRTLEAFCLNWAGIAPDRTPIMFVEPSGEPGEEDFRDWQAAFFDANAYGRDLVPEERRTGSYMDVFGVRSGVRDDGTRLLPGNGMWVHPDRGEVVSWFRGYNGYWPHHYRHPITNYADYVCIYGHIAYAVPDPAWRVLAAAMKDGWLYVMVAEDLGPLVPSMPPAQPAYSGQVWCSQPYDATGYHYSLWRYPLTTKIQPDSGIETYIAAPHEDAEKLWDGALELAYGAWSFDREVTKCVTVQLPRVAAWSPVYVIEGGAWVPSSSPPATYPQVEAERLELAIELEPVPHATLSRAVAPTLVAEDDGVELHIVEAAVEAGYSRVEYRCGELAVPAIEHRNAAGQQWWDRRVMVYAHLPTRTFLFYRWRTDLSPVAHVLAGYELYVDGEAVQLDEPAAIDQDITAGPFDIPAASNFLLRMANAYDDGVTSWVRPIDAMTFLLGFTFITQGAASAGGTASAPGYGFQTCPLITYSYSHANYIEHSAAGGYLFGSVGGSAASQYWDNFPFAKLYGANRGSYLDDEPLQSPVLSHLGAAATHGEHTLAIVGLQPMLAVAIGGTGGQLYNLALANRVTRFGTGGDAAAVLDPLFPPGQWTGCVLWHTGAPRLHQRGAIPWQ